MNNYHFSVILCNIIKFEVENVLIHTASSLYKDVNIKRSDVLIVSISSIFIVNFYVICFSDILSMILLAIIYVSTIYVSTFDLSLSPVFYTGTTS